MSNTECLTLVGALPGNNCGAFFSPYVFTGSIYQYFIGCPASLNIGLSFQNQCNPSSLTWSNIGYSAPMPGQIHADSFSLAAIPAGKFVTITLNTTTCGTFTQTFTGPMAATNINFYAAPFSIPAICTVTNFAIASNFSITGNSGYSFGNLNFTVLSTTWNTLLPVNVGNTVTVNGIYSTSNGNYGCNPQFTISAKQPAIQLLKNMCNYSDYAYCLNPNDTIVYSLAIQNYGNANLTGASIKDVLPVGLEYIPNTSTFGIYNTYTTCIPANQPGTGISVAHAESSATTNLQWNLPSLNATCNTGSNWYVINFKAKITNAAPVGWLTNSSFCYDASNVVIGEANLSNNYSHVYICERKLSLEYRKEVSADSITWDSCVSVAPGSSVYYRLKVKNPGNVSYSQLKIIDILPNTSIAGSDIHLVNCNVRGSSMPIYLTNYIPLGNASSITYSTSPQPTRGTAAELNFSPDLTIGCNTAPAWGIPSIGTIQNQKSVRIDFGAYVLGAGQTETFTYLAQIPPGATTGMIGWNSFAATAFQGAVQTLGAECPKICVTIKDSGCACIGNFVWMDSNGNGLQDTGEPGINGCTITLFNASNVQIGLPHISANNISGMPGYYSFCGMPAGNYYIVVTPPAGLMLTIQNNSNPPLNSDINPANYTSARFAFNCQTNNDLDIGLVEDDGCDCKNSSWGNIYISNNVVINPHYEAISKKGKVIGNGGVIGPYNPSNTTTLTCTKQPQPITLVCKTTYNFAALYNCSKPNCGKVNIVITLPNGTTTTTTNTGSFTTTDGGFYTVNIYGMCGNKICDSCKFIFKVVCPICPCDPKLKVTLGTQSIAHITSSPAYTLVGQNFSIATPPGMLYTQVRAEVVGFTLKSDFNNECISCKNLPYTWASIYNASNINTNASVADSITMGTVSPVIQFTPSLTNTHQNPRETIWSNYSGFTIPNTMNLQFVLPPKSIITCCKLYGKICVKFTFRDRECKECEVVICFDYTILPTNGTSNPYNDASIDVANDLGGIKKEIQATKLGCDNCNPTNDPLQFDKKSVDNINSIAEIKEQSVEAALKELKEEIKQLNELKAKGIKRGVVESLPVLEQKVKELSSLPRK